MKKLIIRSLEFVIEKLDDLRCYVYESPSEIDSLSEELARVRSELQGLKSKKFNLAEHLIERHHQDNLALIPPSERVCYVSTEQKGKYGKQMLGYELRLYPTQLTTRPAF